MAKSASVYVFSTLTSDMMYRTYGEGGGDVLVVDKEVFVKGGSNLPDKRLITPYGVMTEVSEEDYALLEANEVFKLHKANGFITVRDKPADAEKVATDMETRDQSAPLVDADFTEEADAKGLTGSTKPVENKSSRKA